MKEILFARMEELLKEINESIENHNRLKSSLDIATHSHNTLVGRFEEAKSLYKTAEEEEIKKLAETTITE